MLFTNLVTSSSQQLVNAARSTEAVLSGEQIISAHSSGFRYNAGIPVNACTKCFALRWRDELDSICCMKGKINLPSFPDPPLLLKNLWTGDDDISKTFRDYARTLNNALALTSQELHEKILPGNRWNPSIVIQGKVFHRIGPLRAEPSNLLYFRISLN